MLYSPLKAFSCHNFKSLASESSELDLSSDFASICQHLQEETKTDSYCLSAFVCIYGEPGCGRTTCLLEICDRLLRIQFVKESEILGVRVRSGCNLQSLWNLLIDIAKEKQDRDTAVLLSQATVKLAEKYAAAQAFISSNFKLICIDDIDSDGSNVWSHLTQILDKPSGLRVIVASRKHWNCLEEMQSGEVLKVEAKGLTKRSSMNFIASESTVTLSEVQISKIYFLTSGNPTAVKLFLNLIREFKSSSETIDQLLSTFGDQPTSQVPYTCIQKVLQLCFQFLTGDEKHVFCQLSQLREPLPAVDVPEEVDKLVSLGLVTKELFTVSSNSKSSIFTLCVASCLGWPTSFHLCSSPSDEIFERKPFSVFGAWFSLLSLELRELVSDAENNAWPFVPEKWQYISNVGAAESYNIKELITSRNSYAPSFSELDILEECLFHAINEKRYRSVAALVFVMDRFTYWQGGSQRTLQLMEHLNTHSPATPIAPQLIIRKVRVMKNSGDLQGAEQVLDELLAQKNQLGSWVYKEKHHHQLVSAVCIQIKGDVQYNLGQWAEGARLLLDSIILFSTLPIPDKKGIASSLALLGNCLQPMALHEYIPLAQSYGLTTVHPLLQAYLCACEAAVRSVFTPLFYARHKCRAGEFLLGYSNLIPDKDQRRMHVLTSIDDFKESIQAHKDMQSLKSREQFYVFVCAVYKIGLAHQELALNEEMQRGKHIEEMSMLMYEHYCSFTGVIVLDDGVRKLIAHCLNFLGLKQFSEDEQARSYPSIVSQVAIPRESSSDAGKSNSFEATKPMEAVSHQSKEEVANEGMDHATLLRLREESHSVTANMNEMLYKETDCNAMVSSAVSRTRSSLLSVDRSATPKVISNNELKEEPRPTENSTEKDSEIDFRDSTVDRDCITKETLSVSGLLHERNTRGSSTVSRTIPTVDSVNNGEVSQEMDRETVDSPGAESPAVDSTALQSKLQDFKLDRSQRVYGAIVKRFDYISKEWRSERTLAFVGKMLELKKGKKGAQRDAFMVEFVNQEDPLAKYVAKCYRKPEGVQQYKQDVVCQMTARYYVGLFNQHLYHAGVNIGHVQFLPVSLLQLNGDNESSEGVYNVEPYMAGEFVKLSNNFSWARSDHKFSDLLLAFSHFSYQASNELLMIVDIQGWTPVDMNGCTYLTDPQIHSVVYKCFGSANLGKAGIDSFWNQIHPSCNSICAKLGLVRPNVVKQQKQ